MVLECLSGEWPPSLWEGCSYLSEKGVRTKAWPSLTFLRRVFVPKLGLLLPFCLPDTIKKPLFGASLFTLHFPGSYMQNKLFLCKLLSLRYSVITAESGNIFPSLPSFDIAVQATYPMLQFCLCCSAVPGAYHVRSEWAQHCPVALEPELWPEHYELFLLDGKEVYPVTVHCFLLWCSRHDF